MSEQQNIQTVQSAYAAFKRGDIQGVLNTLTDEIEWHTPGEGLIPQAGSHTAKMPSPVSFKPSARPWNLQALTRKPSWLRATTWSPPDVMMAQ